MKKVKITILKTMLNEELKKLFNKLSVCIHILNRYRN